MGTKPKQYNHLMQLAVKYLSGLIELNLADTPSKHFMIWILNNEIQHENYLRMLGIAGSIELELKLFSKVIGEEKLSQMANYICLLNAYFGYETLSDNLAVGLAPSRKEDTQGYLDQKRVLIEFNNIMIKKLNGSDEDITSLFSPFIPLIKQISVSQKTLAPAQMKKFIADYLKHNPLAPPAELDQSFLEILILNVITCLQLLNALADSPIYLILKKSLLARYSSVNNIIVRAKNASYSTLCGWGLNSILTIPTLAYCIGTLEQISPHKNFASIIDNHLLLYSLADAALLTRLLNDVGTRLLTMNEKQRNQVKAKFYAFAKKNPDLSIFSCLETLSEASDFFNLLTRIRKDIKFGEFNICLDRLSRRKLLMDSMIQFCNSIDYYAVLYQNHQKRMLDNLKILSETLGDDQFSNIIFNFVSFHQKKYQMEFETTRGDYAVTDLYKKVS